MSDCRPTLVKASSTYGAMLTPDHNATFLPKVDAMHGVKHTCFE